MVLKALTCWLLALMVGLTAQAQPQTAVQASSLPRLLISGQTPGRIEVGSRMAMLTDSSRSLEFEQVSDPTQTWLAIQQASPNFGFTNDAYWFRLSIDNLTGHELARLIELPVPFLDEVHLFHAVAEQLRTSYLLGDEKPFSQRAVRHQNFVMPVKLALGANQIYIRLASTGTIEAPFRIWDPEEFRKASSDENLLEGGLIGILLIMVVYNLFVFFSTRDPNYIFYIAFVASYLLFHLSLTGYTFAYLWPNALRWNSIAISSLMASAALFACLFANSFLQLKEFSRPAWLWINTLACGCAVLVLLTFLLPYSLTVRLGAVITVPVVLTALSMGYWRWWRGARFVRFYCLAWTAVLIGLGILNANKFGLIPVTVWTNNAPQIGIILLAVLLSFTLADRMNDDRTLRLDAQAAALAHERKARATQEAMIRFKEETNRQLEQRVKARTAELNHTLDQLQTANDRLLLLSTTDGLTQINNRAFFDHALTTEHRRARRIGVPLGLILFDIDHFKRINDTHGHLAGDACLQALAKLMRPCMHRAGDVLARYGGEEFVILLLGSQLDSTAVLAEKFRVAIEELQVIHESVVIRLTASFGVVSGIPDQESTPQDFLARAEKMLYLAKNNGRNCFMTSPVNEAIAHAHPPASRSFTVS